MLLRSCSILSTESTSEIAMTRAMRKSETRIEHDEGSADENPDSKYKERGTVGWCSGT
jgi:hypothetical protein